MNHCVEICHYQQNVPQHYYLVDTLVGKYKFYMKSAVRGVSAEKEKTICQGPAKENADTPAPKSKSK